MAEDLTAHAHELVESNRYLTLGTVDPQGRPWTSPVYFAADRDLRTFYWVSRQACQHSRNLEARPDVSLAVFDSTVPPHHGRGLYAVGTASVCAAAHLEEGLTVYPGPPSRAGSPMTAAEVTGSSPIRLFRAEVTTVWVLCPREPGRPCDRHGLHEDHRHRIC